MNANLTINIKLSLSATVRFPLSMTDDEKAEALETIRQLGIEIKQAITEDRSDVHVSINGKRVTA